VLPRQGRTGHGPPSAHTARSQATLPVTHLKGDGRSEARLRAAGAGAFDAGGAAGEVPPAQPLSAGAASGTSAVLRAQASRHGRKKTRGAAGVARRSASWTSLMQPSVASPQPALTARHRYSVLAAQCCPQRRGAHAEAETLPTSPASASDKGWPSPCLRTLETLSHCNTNNSCSLSPALARLSVNLVRHNVATRHLPPNAAAALSPAGATSLHPISITETG
jgi:hypothetical protein